MKALQVLLVGCGHMGGALLERWRALPYSIKIVDPVRSEACKTLQSIPKDFVPDLVVFAVKPQSLEEILPDYARRFGTLPLYISIAAGKPLSYYEKHLGSQTRIVRAMPNTPAQVGAGITALAAGSHATPQDRSSAETLFTAAGKVVWLEDEGLMHAITALSGSGPAYVFLFLESLTEAGVEAGLTPAIARKLALETLEGACTLAAHKGADFAALRQEVTSPGGTTEAALQALSGLPEMVKTAVNQAINKSKKLSGE